MSHNTRSDQTDANLRRTAVKRYRAGTPATEVARQPQLQLGLQMGGLSRSPSVDPLPLGSP